MGASKVDKSIQIMRCAAYKMLKNVILDGFFNYLFFINKKKIC